MTRSIMPVNIFIAVDWTQGPLSKIDSHYHLNDPQCTGFYYFSVHMSTMVLCLLIMYIYVCL